jgi:segregation and condensation protein B
MNESPEANEETKHEAAAPPDNKDEAQPAQQPAEQPAEARAEEVEPQAEPAAEAVEAAELSVEAGAQDSLPAEAAEPPAVEAPAEQPFARRLELILEALLLAADGPLPLDQMQKLVGSEFNLGRKDLRAALERMSARYAGSASELQEVATGWRLQVRAEYGEWIGRLWQEKPPRYSRALLETLALIVYRQPITRGEIEDVRGVSVSTNILRTLLERGWVREVGHKEVPGRPSLYGTTPQFLDDMNLKSLDQLPSLPEIKDLDQLEAAIARLSQGGAAEAVQDMREEREAAEEPIQMARDEQPAAEAETETEEPAAERDEYDQTPPDETEAPAHDEPADH